MGSLDGVGPGNCLHWNRGPPPTDTMKALVILREGKGDHAAVKAALRREFKAAGISYEIKDAETKKQAEKFVHKHAKNFDLVVAGGGDGTVSRVLSGPVSYTHLTLPT